MSLIPFQRPMQDIANDLGMAWTLLGTTVSSIGDGTVTAAECRLVYTEVLESLRDVGQAIIRERTSLGHLAVQEAQG